MPSPLATGGNVQTAPPASRVLLLTTGGTIAGLAPDAAFPAYEAARLSGADLVASVGPLAREVASGSVACESVAQIDSKDMSWAVWRALAARVRAALDDASIGGIVVTHGTDTLEETAYLLHRLLAPSKPVVLTAAMRPANALDADGPRNLLDALAVARHRPAAGVTAVVAGSVWAGCEVRKSHTWKIDAFDAGDAGPLGWMRSGVPHFVRPVPVASSPASDQPAATLTTAMLDGPEPWVEVLHSHAVASARGVRAWVDAGVQGIVVACTGGGTVHAQLEPALIEAKARGVQVMRSTRVPRGGVGERADAALPGAGALTPAQARVELMLRIAAGGG